MPGTNQNVVVVSDAALIVMISRYSDDALAEVDRRHAGAVFALARRLLAERAEGTIKTGIRSGLRRLHEALETRGLSGTVLP